MLKRVKTFEAPLTCRHCRSRSVCNRPLFDNILLGGGEGCVRRPAPWSGTKLRECVGPALLGSLHIVAGIAKHLAQKFRVEVVDEDFFDSCFGEAVLAIHGDELAANALQLRQGHGRRGELERLLHILHLYLSSSFSLVVFLVCHYLSEDIGCGLVELVEVILLGRRFLLGVSKSSRHEGVNSPALSQGSA